MYNTLEVLCNWASTLTTGHSHAEPCCFEFVETVLDLYGVQISYQALRKSLPNLKFRGH